MTAPKKADHLTARQVQQLLQPVAAHRVLTTTEGHGYLAQQDVKAHLTRIFGFGNYAVTVREVVLLFEHNRVRSGAKTGTRWDVGYRATVRLEIRSEDGGHLTHYEDGATFTAEGLKRGDAHDFAMKSAISTALKRAATNLGDQFGLSLYNDSDAGRIVGMTLVGPLSAPTNSPDLQDQAPTPAADVVQPPSEAKDEGEDEDEESGLAGVVRDTRGAADDG